MGRKVGNHLTAAGCVGRTWAQEFASSPCSRTYSALTVVLAARTFEIVS